MTNILFCKSTFSSLYVLPVSHKTDANFRLSWLIVCTVDGFMNMRGKSK